MSLEIIRLDGPILDAAIPDLAVILADAVAGGASVGLLLPIPSYAGMPDSELRPTTIFYRELGPNGRGTVG
jgi:hypothetical protein